LGNELLAHATHGHERAAQRLADPRIAPRVRPVGVGLEQNVGASKLGGRMGAGADQTSQQLALLPRETNDHFVR
jgi:hypothetical protein